MSTIMHFAGKTHSHPTGHSPDIRFNNHGMTKNTTTSINYTTNTVAEPLITGNGLILV